ncbi:hypothetical protein DXG01_007833 [Tephrocybe rancida]|nr:hypothetical protein DXG01_007833 [Tephrocybe rancida]
MPRARRASTPPKIVWKDTSASYPSPATPSQPNLSQSLHSAKRRVSFDHDGPTVQRKGCNDGKADTKTLVSVHEVFAATSEATVVDFRGVANATPQGSIRLSESPRRPTRSHDTDRKTTIVDTDTTPRLRHSVSTGIDRRTPMHLIKTISTKSLRSARIVIGFEALHESFVALKPTIDSPSLKSAPSTPKTLRRKKRLSLYRPSTPRPESVASSSFTATSSPSIVSMPQSAVSVEDSIFSVPRTEPDMSKHARSRSQPANVVRLGHPSRPLYSAIRPNMSRPSTAIGPPARPSRPISLPAPSRAPSPGIMSVLSSPSALYDEDGYAFERPTSSHGRGVPSFPAFGSISRRDAGFSLSGETELRMALARDHVDAFKFKDMGKRHSGKVMTKVKQVGKGLKGLVMRSH